MDELLKLPVSDRRPFFEQAAHATGYPEGIIEKDFWVCVVLRELFALRDVGPHLTFKGGTSLSKAYGLIKRFSEDVDLVIDRQHLGFEGTLSQKGVKKLKKSAHAMVNGKILPALEDRLRTALPKGQTWKLEPATREEDPDEQTLLFHYPRTATPAVASIREVVKVEMGARSDVEPHEDKAIRAYVGDLAALKGDASYGVQVRVVHPRRTLWEKVCAIHEVNVGSGAPKRGMSRHYYDVNALLHGGYAKSLADEAALIRDVIQHRRWAFARKGVDYDAMDRGEFSLAPAGEQADEWQKDYAVMAVMFAEVPPTFEDLMAELQKLESRLRDHFKPADAT